MSHVRNSQADKLLDEGEFIALAKLSQQLLLKDSGNGWHHYYLACAADALGRLDIAARAAREAASRLNYADPQILAAKYHVASGEEALAVQRLQSLKASSLNGKQAFRVGGLYRRLDRPDGAIPFYERALSLDPDDPEARFHLAVSYIHSGDKRAGLDELERLLTLHPSHGRGHLRLARMQTWTADDNHIERLIAASHDPADDQNLQYILYALAKEAEDCRRFKLCWDSLQRANDIRSRSNLRPEADDEQLFEYLLKEAQSDAKTPAAYPSTDPVFVTGMPRTGTTLLDTMLSAHSGFNTIGEAEALPLCVKQLTGTTTPLITDISTLAAARSINGTELSRLYNTTIAPRVMEGVRPIDQLPINLLYADIILSKLDGAKVLSLRRGAGDTLWSNLKHMFSANFPYYDYSYEPERCARYIVQVYRLQEALEAKWPDRFKIVRYEELVQKSEICLQSICEFLGVSWEPQILDFHKAKGTVATPSSEQVRQPVTAKAIGRWKPFAEQLAPAFEILQAAGIEP